MAPFLHINAFHSAARIYREEQLLLPRVWFRREFDTVVRPGPFSLSGGAASSAAPFAIAPFAIAPAGHRSLGLARERRDAVAKLPAREGIRVV